MLKYNIETIPYKEMRYPSCDDYWTADNVKEFRIADLKNKDYEFLILIHALIEEKLAEKRGIKEEDITKFDIEFEKNRTSESLDEPGDDPKSPYRSCHFIATNFERMLATILEVDWAEYNDYVESL